LVIERILPESLRGQHHGSRVLAMAEEAVRERGCVLATALMVGFPCAGVFMWREYDVAAQLYCTEHGSRHFF